MAENIPNPPGGAVPPPRKETGKVQPKKETVRINLPPKPSAAPTIKLPTLPPGGPTGAASSPTAPAPGATLSTPASAPRATAAPVAQRPAAPAAQKPAPRPAAKPTVGTFDTILAVAAMIVCLAAVGSAVYLAFILNTD